MIGRVLRVRADEASRDGGSRQDGVKEADPGVGDLKRSASGRPCVGEPGASRYDFKRINSRRCADCPSGERAYAASLV